MKIRSYHEGCFWMYLACREYEWRIYPKNRFFYKSLSDYGLKEMFTAIALIFLRPILLLVRR